MRLALLQCNTTVGALGANAALLLERGGAAVAEGARLVVGPELALSGYPPRDLLVQEGFLEACRDACERLAASWTSEVPLLVGTPWPAPSGRVWNALVVCRAGVVETVYAKRLLPTYDVFDEERYFEAGVVPTVIDVDGVGVGLAICEDLWRGDDIVDASDGGGRYAGRPEPIAELVRAGAQIVACASASPFTHDKLRAQRAIVAKNAKAHGVIVASANLVGASDDLVFPGGSEVCNTEGEPIACAPLFAEDTLHVETEGAPRAADPLAGTPREELIYRALVLGVRDYFGKTGVRRCVLGVSGGIDSAVVCAIAARALGASNVIGLAMPSRHSSGHSVEDARELCARLGVAYRLVPIGSMHGAVEADVAGLFTSLDLPAASGVAEENVQSRLRGLVVMAVANKAGAIALATGNKSELSVGYCTLYGDMNGGLAVISDVLKQDVYALSRWINDHHEEAGFDGPPIPENTITKPPSAELAPGQLDSDSLPPYEVLDEILHRYVEQRQHPDRILEETGFDEAVVRRITRLTDLNEHKRHQMPLGLKVSSIAFGRGRRRPLVQGSW